MIDIVADLHLHSKYSRAVSSQMILPVMAQVGQQKGIDLLSSADWTHPLWFREMQSILTETNEGIYTIKGDENSKTRFFLSVEIATIFSQNGKGRRIHQLIFAPSFDTVAKINHELLKRGCNLSSDGRPTIGLSSKHLLELILSIDKRCLLIPAHVWTPWFGIYGEMSGFNSLSEAFEELAPYVYGIETGLSSDPEMNWQMEELETRSILSFSDAHSPAKMGREATIFHLENLSYEHIRQSIMAPSIKKQESRSKKQDDNRVLYTIEFYPEEGKYHFSGHRKCNVTMTPEEQEKVGSICPVCHRKITDGVMRRLTELSKNKETGEHTKNNSGLMWIADKHKKHPPFVKIVPLLEIIAEAIGSPITSPKTRVLYDELCKKGTSEFHVLLYLPFSDIEQIARQVSSPEKAARITDAIDKMRQEKIVVIPGYDGVFGTVKIWPEDKNVAKNTDTVLSKEKQIGLF